MHIKTLLIVPVFALLISLLLIPAFFPSQGVYVSIAAVGLAVALQKYVASFAGYFVLRLSRLFQVGDRIRIGTTKGDVRGIGLLHFVLDEVGEGQSFGGELTGRILHIPNHTVLDQSVLNFSQNFSSKGKLLSCGFMFDEVSLRPPPGTPVEQSRKILEDVLREEDGPFLAKAKLLYERDVPNFLSEADRSPRVMVFMDGQQVVLVGKFVAPVRGRNSLKSTITLRFLEAMEGEIMKGSDQRQETLVKV